MEIELTFAPNYVLFGFDWYEKDEMYDFNELNIYFLFMELKFMW